MKKVIAIIFTTLICAASVNAKSWKPAGNHIKTEWGENLNPENVWQEYPRPIMEREQWANLNGLWDYAITPVSAGQPSEYESEILVPFAVESSLSGVGRTLDENQALWYRRDFTVPSSWKGKDIMLNFGAVDWKADVWVNGIKVGSHTGGYTPFSIDITPALKKGQNELSVRVWDPTDHGYQPRGKQVLNPLGIWYTPVSGIWQTVWLEPVSRRHISDLRIQPDIDRRTLSVKALSSGNDSDLMTEVKVFDGSELIASGKSINGEDVVVAMPADCKLWSPDSPALYDLDISIYDRSGAKLDNVKSYAAMRKFSMKRDDRGIMRMQLNNEDLFQYGPLDQGWWPDGLYTAPSYDAMKYDIDKTKDWGFNMIRKHIKVEPALWYTYCDRKGIIVWQDMPSGDTNPEWQNHRYFDGVELNRSADSEATYRKEWKEIIDCLYNYPCIASWIPFNEAWGQFKTPEIAAWTKNYDPTRLVNPASGGNFYTCGDILDLHNYPAPEMYLFDAQRVNVLGEYGGIGMVVDGHIWTPERNWGYVQFKSPKEVTDEYVKYADMLYRLVETGFCGAVYTQTTDVEIEINGLMTYDRKVIKIDEDRVRQANKKLTQSLNRAQAVTK